MEYETSINKNMVNGQFGVYSFAARINKQKKTGVADTKVVQLKIICGGETLVHYDYGWIAGHRYINLYKPLVEHLDGLKVKKV